MNSALLPVCPDRCISLFDSLLLNILILPPLSRHVRLGFFVSSVYAHHSGSKR